MDSSQQLGHLLQSLADKAPDALDNDARALLADAAARYPYFAVPALALIRDGHTDNDTDSLRQRLALTASSQRTLAFAAYGDQWRDFYPAAAEPQPQDTTDVIDTFLRTYGSCTPEEEALIEKMIFNPAPDYAGMLAREEQENLPEAPTDAPDSPDARIAAFILREHPAAHKEEEPEPQADEEAEKSPIPRPEHSDDSLLSESLARIFIKQGRYERAHEIISGLRLKFPKKSAYFADQLRFLQKLIINQRRKEASQSHGDSKN